MLVIYTLPFGSILFLYYFGFTCQCWSFIHSLLALSYFYITLASRVNVGYLYTLFWLFPISILLWLHVSMLVIYTLPFGSILLLYYFGFTCQCWLFIHSLLAQSYFYISLASRVNVGHLYTPFWLYPISILLWLHVSMLVIYTLPFGSILFLYYCGFTCQCWSFIHSLLALSYFYITLASRVNVGHLYTPFWLYLFLYFFGFKCQCWLFIHFLLFLSYFYITLASRVKVGHLYNPFWLYPVSVLLWLHMSKFVIYTILFGSILFLYYFRFTCQCWLFISFHFKFRTSLGYSILFGSIMFPQYFA